MRRARASWMRWLLIVMLCGGCAGTHARRLVELRGHHARAITLATRDDDQARFVTARAARQDGAFSASVVPIEDPRVLIDLPPLQLP